MSRALLKQAAVGKTTSVPGPNDDVESFVWVLSYCVMRNLYQQAFRREEKDIRDQFEFLGYMFHQVFGQVDIRQLALHRQSGSDALEFPVTETIDKIIAAYMSDALVCLFGRLQDLLADAHKRYGPTPLTHVIILTKVNDAIAELEEAIPSPPLPVP
jgi:hypothetical protein